MSFVEVVSKSALSSMTVVVPGAMPESSPPMMPATAFGFSASQIISIVGSSLRTTPSSVIICSPSFASRTTIVRSFSFVWSKAWSGWPSSSIT